MTLTLRTDPSHPAGGFALLEGDALAGLSSLTIENSFSGLYLGDDGKWGRHPSALPVEPVPGGVSLGPHIVDHVPTELQVEFRSGDGRPLGKLFWTDVIPSRNPGSVTSAQVLEERQRRAQQQAEDTAAAARIAAQRAEEEAREREVKEREAKEREASERALLAERERAAEAEEARRRVAASEEAKRLAPPAGPKVTSSPVAPTAAAPASARRSRGLLLALLILLPLLAVATVLGVKPQLLGLLRQPDDRGVATPSVAARAVPPAPAPPLPGPARAKFEPQPAKPEPIKPEPAKPVDCGAFDRRITTLQGKPDGDKVALGEEALQAGCGSEAFLAFDAADPQSNEAAAWNVARFYDPNVSNPVYRGAASIHPENAAAYYRMWRDRSPRQAEALARICATAGSSNASLRRSCGR